MSTQEAARVPRGGRGQDAGSAEWAGCVHRLVGLDPGRWVGCRKELDFVPREMGLLEGQAGDTGLSHIL